MTAATTPPREDRPVPDHTEPAVVFVAVALAALAADCPVEAATAWAGLAAAATGLRRPAPAPATPPRRPTIPFPSEDPTVTKTLAWLIVFAWLALLVVLAVAFGLAFAHWQRHPLLSALLPAALGLLVGGYLAGGIVAALARSLGVVWSHPSLPSAVAGVLLGWYSPDDGEEGE